MRSGRSTPSREHGLPPGRTVALRLIVRRELAVLLEGRDHLARRRLMLPPIQASACAYETIVRAGRARRRALAGGRSLRSTRRCCRSRSSVILRAVFGVADPERRERLAGRLGRLLAGTASPGLQFGVLLSRRVGGPDPLDAAAARSRDEIDVAAGRGDRGAPRRPARGHPLAAGRRALRGRRRDRRRRDPRPAHDAPVRGARDDGDGARLDVRPAAAPSARARRGSWPRSTPAGDA